VDRARQAMLGGPCWVLKGPVSFVGSGAAGVAIVGLGSGLRWAKSASRRPIRARSITSLATWASCLDSDSLTPVPGLMEVVEKTKAAYARANAVDKFKFTLQPNTGHDVTPEALQEAIGWLEQWPKPSARQ